MIIQIIFALKTKVEIVSDKMFKINAPKIPTTRIFTGNVPTEKSVNLQSSRLVTYISTNFDQICHNKHDKLMIQLLHVSYKI